MSDEWSLLLNDFRYAVKNVQRLQVEMRQVNERLVQIAVQSTSDEEFARHSSDAKTSMEQISKRFHRESNELTIILKDLTLLCTNFPDRKAQFRKLSAEATTALDTYRTTHRECLAVATEGRRAAAPPPPQIGRTVPSLLKSKARRSGGDTTGGMHSAASEELQEIFGGDAEHASEDAGLLQPAGRQQVAQQRHHAVTFQDTMDEEILDERRKEMTEIATDVQEINEIFVHMRQLVGEQGEQIDLIEHNTDEASRQTELAAEQLKEARKLQRSRVKHCFVAVALIAFIVAVVLYLLLHAG